MTLLNAPEYNGSRETRNRNLLIGAGALVVLVIVIGLGGFMLGHGWFFSNLPIEHKVDTFFSAIEAKDYNKAFTIYTNDPDWQQHPLTPRRHFEDRRDRHLWQRRDRRGARQWRPQNLHVVRAQGWHADGTCSA
jgi:hypothetical protein